MTGRALLLAVLAAGAIGVVPAAACRIEPPATTVEGRAAEARRAGARQARLDRAEAVFVAVVGQARPFAVTDRPLRGVPPTQIDLPANTCSPFWRPGQRLVIYATRREGRWTVLRAVPDTPAARADARRHRPVSPP